MQRHCPQPDFALAFGAGLVIDTAQEWVGRGGFPRDGGAITSAVNQHVQNLVLSPHLAPVDDLKKVVHILSLLWAMLHAAPTDTFKSESLHSTNNCRALWNLTLLVASAISTYQMTSGEHAHEAGSMPLD